MILDNIDDCLEDEEFISKPFESDILTQYKMLSQGRNRLRS